MDDQSPYPVVVLAREWQRIQEVFAAVAIDVRRYVEEDLPRAVLGIRAALQDGAKTISAAHVLLRRRGYIPTLPLLQVAQRSDVILPEALADTYAEALRRDGLHDIAERMEQIARIAGLGEHELSVRAIFPEIERIAREKTYEVGVMDGITSLPSLRTAVNELCLKQSLKEAVYAYTKIDLFVLTLISAFDYAYASTPKAGSVSKPESVLYRRAFKKVPNRHVVLHGLQCDYDEAHVVNALTLLFVMARIGAVFEELGERVPQAKPKRFDAELKAWRDSRRRMNRSFRDIWTIVGGQRGRPPGAPLA